MKRLQPKHQRLVLQCYPPGRAADKKPNGSELSYLLYYVSARRAKLSKVGPFLEKNARHEVNRGKTGNAEVTLGIAKALIERCHENLNLFGSNVMAILSVVLANHDLTLCQHAADVFAVFCKYQDHALFSGDPAYAHGFNRLITDFLAVAKGSNSPTDFAQWRLVGIHSARSVASSAVLAVSTNFDQISQVVPFALAVLDVDTQGETLRQLETELEASREAGQVVVESVAAHAAAADNAPTADPETATGPDQEPDSASQGSKALQLAALDTLRYLYENTGSVQVARCTREVTKNILERNFPLQWATTLLQLTAKWTPVQLRFVIATTLADMLAHQDLSDIRSQLAISRLFLSLFTSQITMVGLSVMDILRVLLTHLHALVRYEPQVEDKKSYQELIVLVRTSITAVNTHTYYADQLSDVVTELLSRCRYQKVSDGRVGGSDRGGSLPPSGTSVSSSIPGATELATNLRRISESLHSSSNHSASRQRSTSINYDENILLSDLETVRSLFTQVVDNGRVRIQAWEGTQGLLLHDNRVIRLAYVAAFEAYVAQNHHELDKFRPRDDYKVTRGTLGRFLIYIYALAIDSAAHRTDYLLVHHLLNLIVEKFGTSGVVRVVPFCLNLLDTGSAIIRGESSIEYELSQGIAQVSLALAALSHVARVVQNEELGAKVDSIIGSRQHQNLWYEYIDVPVKHHLADDIDEKSQLLEPSFDGQRARENIVVRDEIAPLVDVPQVDQDLKHILTDSIAFTSLEEALADNPANEVESINDGTDTVVAVPKTRSLRQLRASSLNTERARERIVVRVPSTHGTLEISEFQYTGKEKVPGVRELKRMASDSASGTRAFKNINNAALVAGAGPGVPGVARTGSSSGTGGAGGSGLSPPMPASNSMGNLSHKFSDRLGTANGHSHGLNGLKLGRKNSAHGSGANGLVNGGLNGSSGGLNGSSSGLNGTAIPEGSGSNSPMNGSSSGAINGDGNGIGTGRIGINGSSSSNSIGSLGRSGSYGRSGRSASAGRTNSRTGRGLNGLNGLNGTKERKESSSSYELRDARAFLANLSLVGENDRGRLAN